METFGQRVFHRFSDSYRRVTFLDFGAQVILQSITFGGHLGDLGGVGDTVKIDVLLKRNITFRGERLLKKHDFEWFLVTFRILGAWFSVASSYK